MKKIFAILAILVLMTSISAYAAEVEPRNVEEFGSRPVTDFITQCRPDFRNDIGEYENMEKVHISSYSDLPLVIGDETVYSIDIVQKYGEKVLRLKLKEDSSGIRLFYVKNGNDTASEVGSTQYLGENDEETPAEQNADGTYNIYYSLEKPFCDDKNSPNALNSDYIILSNSFSRKAVLIDNVFKK